MAARRPALKLAIAGDVRAAGALHAERQFWEELDRRRVRILQQHLRLYVSAVRKGRSGRQLSLFDDHALRVECATRHLPFNPLKDYGLQRYFDETRQALVERQIIPDSTLTWLPDVSGCFDWLNR